MDLLRQNRRATYTLSENSDCVFWIISTEIDTCWETGLFTFKEQGETADF